MAKMTDNQRSEKVIKKLQAAIAEAKTLQSLWPDERVILRNAVLEIEDLLATTPSLWDEPTNR
ncbi:hypothetical protein NKH94_15635 [Mesorhizobium australicum]|uniref:hypothetical protein n=1 Tax=Mesorhizobium australicum TaxID=536018 RepID=UPI003335D1A0